MSLRRTGVNFVVLAGLLASLLGLAATPALSSRAVMQSSSTTSPILLIVNSSATNKFGSYLGEILRAEGLTAFDQVELSSLTAAQLAQYDLAILAQTPLSAAQASMLSAYVSGGKSLIAMRPDAQINSLFGLMASAGTLTDGYLQIQNAAAFNGAAPGYGLTSATLQIHGATDQYTTAPGAVTIAQLYSNATNSTSYPAVVAANYAAGQAVAFTYDLPLNVAYTRQGNPANANLDLDGDWWVRTPDLFQTAGGGAPWIDRDKIPIPQADEQQRLFARIVQQLVGRVRPLPQLWYFPETAKTMLILTSDAHWNNGLSDFTQFIADLNARQGQVTMYLGPEGNWPSSATLQAWQTQGHTFGIHPYRVDGSTLTAGFNNIDSLFSSTYTIPRSTTVRIHRYEWEGWTSAADIEAAHNIALDVSFAAWGPWLRKSDGTWPHGYVNGSGLPMKFIRTDGTLSPVYQQFTHLSDDQLLTAEGGPEGKTGSQGVLVSQGLIDASLAGNYSALTELHHVDYYSSKPDLQVWLTGNIDYARSKGVPIWNADRWLGFTQTRHDANYTNIVWNSSTGVLSFSLTMAATAGLTPTTMLPLSYGGRPLQSITVDGGVYAFSVQTIKSTNVAFVSIPAGNHSVSATYSGTPPTPTNTPTPAPTNTPGPSPTFTATPTNTPTSTPLPPTATPGAGLVFPSAQVLDNFNRSSGVIGSGWSGLTSGYAIAANQLDTGSGDAYIFWNAAAYGSDQEVFVTLQNIDQAGTEQDLILKSQSNSSWSGGLIEVLYDHSSQSVQVWTYAPSQSWVKRGADIPVVFSNGDQFGARARSDGIIEVYRNGVLLGIRDGSGWTYSGSGGYIGLWFINAGNAVLDDFGGGAVVANATPTATPTPTNTPLPSTATATPTNTPTNTPLPPTATATPTATPTPVPFTGFVDTTAADFSAGILDVSAYLAQTNDGEVMLAPALGAEFSGTELPSDWFSTPWATGGSATVGSGVLAVDGALIGTNSYYSPGHSLEFVATFGANTSEHMGFGTDLNAEPWAIFSTGYPGGTTLRARTSTGITSLDTDLGGAYLGAPHRYRVDWTGTGVVYFIDGIQVASHAIAITANMRPVGSDLAGGPSLSVDWMRMSPFASTGVYVSRLLDAGTSVQWLNLTPLISQPNGTALTFETRAGNTTTPDDGTWSTWTSVTGTVIGSPGSRYLQYRTTLTSTDSTTSPVLQQVTITYQGPAEPTATPTNTPLPPTATPTATATNPPTATNTPLPPTATPTATNTPLPPTATPTNTPTSTPTATPTNTPTPTATPSNTGLLSPSSNAAVTASAGDNNGFQTSPTNAYAGDGLFAVDTNSGTTTSTSCTDTGKDKHNFYTFNVNLPGTAAVQGIEVRLDGRVDNTAGTPRFCAQISWNGGATWTAAQSTATLGTATQTFILGGPANIWGRIWAAGDFSNANFRVRVINVSSSTARDFSLDWVVVRVTYR